nr:hypothetical protein [Tanacetum cinerariifolium]
MDDDIAPDAQLYSSDDEDIGNAHIPKAAYYLDVGLEQMVPDQMWIEKECKYDIAAMYGISHSWFQRQRFYINRHTFEGDRIAVRTHMQIFSVVRIKVFSMYGQRIEDFQLGIESYQTQLNLTKPRWDATALNTSTTTHDGTLHQIDEALDYRVKEFKVNRMNPQGVHVRHLKMAKDKEDPP